MVQWCFRCCNGGVKAPSHDEILYVCTAIMCSLNNGVDPLESHNSNFISTVQRKSNGIAMMPQKLWKRQHWYERNHDALRLHDDMNI